MERKTERARALRGWWLTAGGAGLAAAVLFLVVVIVPDDGSETLRPVDSHPSRSLTSSIAVASTSPTSAPRSSEPTVPTSTAAAAPTTAAVVPPQVGISRRIVRPELCEPLYARDGVAEGVSLFARPSTNPVPMQIIGDPVDGPTGAFAMIQRYFGDGRTSTGQEAVDIESTTFWVSTFERQRRVGRRRR